MDIYVAGSSSHGNCYLLHNKEECLILEAGIPFKELNRLPFFDLSKVVGCVITHEHGDHAGRINEYLGYGIECRATAGTIAGVKLSTQRLPLLTEHGHTFKLGNFIITAFSTKHDAAEPIGFLIDHAETGRILFATDTYYLPCKFPGLNNILIECNYKRSLLDANVEVGKIDHKRRNRTLFSHMELETCIGALKANDLTKVDKIILIHLSDDNSNEAEFVGKVMTATRCITMAAKPGLHAELSNLS